MLFSQLLSQSVFNLSPSFCLNFILQIFEDLF